jgi:amino acid adenylation domain-containing protein/thioester reductase-like protein
MNEMQRRLAGLSPEQRAHLTRQLAELRKQKGDRGAIQPVARSGNMVPLSFTQQRIWFLEQFAPGHRLHNMSGALRVPMPFDAAVLETCFKAVVRRHESLRTTFTVRDGEPAGIVVHDQPAILRLVDLTDVAAENRDAKAREVMAEEACELFDLKNGPLIRMQVVRMGQNDHFVQLTMHHIISDGWSTRIFFGEIGAMYRALIAGMPSSLEALPFQYADFADWQRQQFETSPELVTYWKNQLEGAPPLLELASDRPRPAVRSYRGGRLPFAFDRETIKALKAFGRAHQATLFMTLLAAFQVLLARHAGEDDILVGAPIANRDQAGTEVLIGAFINMIVLRADLSDDPPFATLLVRVRQTTLDAFAHQRLPFERLLELLQPERNLSYAPLTQVLFNFQTDTTAATGMMGSTFEDIHNGTTQFDLSLNLVENGDFVSGHIDYSVDLFDRETIERLAQRYRILLGGILEDPQKPVQALPCLTEEERDTLLRGWNATTAALDETLSIHRLFEATVQRTPQAVAVIAGADTWTYAELDRRTTQLARHLMAQEGFGPQTRIGLCVGRGIDLLIGLIGILKAGCSYVPIDPEYPASRVAFMAEDAGIRLLVTQSTQIERLPNFEGIVVALDTDWERIEAAPATPLPKLQPNARAYTIYTSGSTGVPKGVDIGHRSVVNFLESMRAKPGMTDADRLLAVTSISFDIAGLELFLPLVVGACVIIATREDAVDGQRLARLINTHDVTLMQATPATWRLLLDAGWEGSRRLSILCGGEPLPPDLASLLLPRCSALWNLYGPTETTIWSTVHKVETVNGPIPIGRPIHNTRVYVLNGRLEPVPVGVAGELYIGGAGVAQGYHNRPELTAERFIADPFEAGPNERLYRTGDLVRYRPDGIIEILGRADNQIKLRGYRIELGEIEAVLSRHIAVKQVVAIIREDVPGQKALVAYVVRQSEIPAGSSDHFMDDGSLEDELKQSAGSHLPDYMVPSRIVFLPALPLTPNGKIDRKALPKPDVSLVGKGDNYLAPRNAIERKLVQIWEDLLQVSPVGVRDSFFELGGHSLLATKLIVKVRDVVGVELPLQFLFQQQPTISGMAEVIARAGSSADADSLAQNQTLDLAADAVLDPSIRAEEWMHVHSSTHPQHVLLTGANGFLGAFLLAELLAQTNATFFCLVRASSPIEAMRRIRESMTGYGIWQPDYEARIVPVVGDLSKLRLGLSRAEFNHFAHMIDVIYHCGATVNFLQTYPALKSANVLGTQEVLRLASQATIKPVHYVSTTYVFSRFDYPPGTTFTEDMDPIHGLAHTFGYTQSKWVSERLAFEAMERGIPVYVYRAGRVAGHSQTGACQTYDFVWQAIKAALELHAAPMLGMTLDVTPVDYVVSALVHISRQNDLKNKAFHLVNPSPISATEFLEWVLRFGYKAERIPFPEWCARVRERAEQIGDETASALAPFFSGALPLDRIPPAYFEAHNTVDGLAGSSIACPKIDDQLLTNYFDYFIRSGYLQPPEKQAM